MANKPPPGKPKPIRWTVNKAESEFDVASETITKRLSGANIVPAKDGKYSTKQIVSALFDDMQAERIRLYREQTKRLELANAKTQLEQVDTKTVYKNYEGVFIAMRQTIQACGMTEAEKTECLANLRHDFMEAKPIE